MIVGTWVVLGVGSVFFGAILKEGWWVVGSGVCG
jgi:uncharacterized membrane protein